MTSHEDSSDPQKLLNSAVTAGDVTRILCLLDDQRVDLDRREAVYDHQTPLMRMCHMDTEAESRNILMQKLEVCAWNPNVQDATGRTLLMHACIADNLEAVLMALENGCDVSLRDKDGNSAVVYAIRHGNEEILGLILQQEEFSHLLSQTNNLGQTPIEIAQTEGHATMTSYLKSLFPSRRSPSNRKLYGTKTESKHTPPLLPPNRGKKKLASRIGDKFFVQTHEGCQQPFIHKPTGLQEGRGGGNRLKTVSKAVHRDGLQSPGKWPQGVTSDHRATPSHEADRGLGEGGTAAPRANAARQSFVNLFKSASRQQGAGDCDRSPTEKPGDGSYSASHTDRPLVRSRKDSVSLPDLRNLKGKLVTSGDITPSVSESLAQPEAGNIKEDDEENEASAAGELYLERHKKGSKSCGLPPIQSHLADAENRKDKGHQYPRTKKQVSSDDILLRSLIF